MTDQPPPPPPDRLPWPAHGACGQTLLTALWRQHSPRVYARARRLLRDEREVTEASQEALRQVLGQFPGLRGDAEVTAWLHRATVRAARRHRRRALPSAPPPVVRRQDPAPAT
jgi:DNA-directed RNA polymerase specialized sigma24 family protein